MTATREEEDALPGLMNRASTVVKARISKLLDRAEDPSITLDYSYEKQRELLQNVKRGVADVVTAKKRLELQSQKLEQEIEKLETQARQALSAGREDLARSALERKALVQQQLQSLDQQGTALEAQQEKLIEAEKRLSAKVEAFRTQKETIKATYSAAEAQVKIGEAASGIGEEMADTGLAIERARDKTEQMQARAAAVEELTAAGNARGLHGAGHEPRPRARSDLGRQPGRRGAGAHEGRARIRRDEEGDRAVIVAADGRRPVRDRRGALHTPERARRQGCGGARGKRRGAARWLPRSDGRARAKRREPGSPTTTCPPRRS